MSEREPDKNGATDEEVWLDLVARLEQMDDGGPRAAGTRPGDGTAARGDGSDDAGPTDAVTRDRTGQRGNGPGSIGPGNAGPNGPGPGPDRSPGGTDAGFSGTGSPDTPPEASAAGRSAAERTRAIFENQPLAAGGPRDYTAPEDEDGDGGFTPPEPPPLGTGEPLVVLAWLGAIGGPVLLLLFAMLWRDAPLPVFLGTVAVFAGSAGYLLFRLPQHRDEGDDGAAV